MNAKLVDTSYNTSFILTKDSKLYSFGYNEEGALGDNTLFEKRVPTLRNFRKTNH